VEPGVVEGEAGTHASRSAIEHDGQLRLGDNDVVRAAGVDLGVWWALSSRGSMVYSCLPSCSTKFSIFWDEELTDLSDGGFFFSVAVRTRKSAAPKSGSGGREKGSKRRNPSARPPSSLELPRRAGRGKEWDCAPLPSYTPRLEAMRD
jgi:hypothetical protein